MVWCLFVMIVITEQHNRGVSKSMLCQNIHKVYNWEIVYLWINQTWCASASNLHGQWLPLSDTICIHLAHDSFFRNCNFFENHEILLYIWDFSSLTKIFSIKYEIHSIKTKFDSGCCRFQRDISNHLKSKTIKLFGGGRDICLVENNEIWFEMRSILQHQNPIVHPFSRIH